MNNSPSEEINSSEENLHLKIKTCCHQKEILNCALEGEMFLVTGANSALYICTKSCSEDVSAEVHKIVDINAANRVS